MEPQSSLARRVALEREQRAARRGRYSLYVAGGVFVALGVVLDTLPALAAVTSPSVAKGCALFGAAILAIGRFASDRFMRRCDAFLTRQA